MTTAKQADTTASAGQLKAKGFDMLELRHDFEKAKQQLKDMKRQLPFLNAYALTKTAQDVRKAEYEEMQSLFDRPTPYVVPKNIDKPGTRGSLFLRGAKKDKLAAKVWVKDLNLGAGTPGIDIVGPHIKGGGRKFKRFEKALFRNGVLPAGMYAVPSKYARKNKYGNLSAGRYTQILSYLRANADVAQNTTANSRRKKTTKPYWIMYENDKPLGIYQGTGSNMKPIIIFVSKPNYKQTFKFEGIGNAVAAQRFESNFVAAWNYAKRMNFRGRPKN